MKGFVFYKELFYITFSVIRRRKKHANDWVCVAADCHLFRKRTRNLVRTVSRNYDTVLVENVFSNTMQM
jgi:hypothetical protein